MDEVSIINEEDSREMSFEFADRADKVSSMSLALVSSDDGNTDHGPASRSSAITLA